MRQWVTEQVVAVDGSDIEVNVRYKVVSSVITVTQIETRNGRRQIASAARVTTVERESPPKTPATREQLTQHLDAEHDGWQVMHGDAGGNLFILHEALHGGSWATADVEKHP